MWCRHWPGQHNSGLGNRCHWATGVEVPQEKKFYFFLSLIWETWVSNKQIALFIHIINFTFCIWTLNGGHHTICNFGATSQQQPQTTRADRRFTSLIDGGSPRFPCNYFHIPILPGSLTKKKKINKYRLGFRLLLAAASSSAAGFFFSFGWRSRAEE